MNLQLFTKTAGYFSYFDATGRIPLVKGVDVHPQFQSIDTANWAQTYANGGRFVWIKVTDGIGTTYAKFTAANIANARAAGLKVGYYHFARPSSATGGTPYTVAKGIAEANEFLTEIATEDPTYGDIMLCLDYEDPNMDWGANGGADAAYNYVEAFINRVKEVTGRQIILYTANTFMTDAPYDSGELTHSTKGFISDICPLWLASYSATYPSAGYEEVSNYNDWLAWQFSETGNKTSWGFPDASAVDEDVLLGDIYTIAKPTKPTALQATNVGSNHIDITWNLVPDTDTVSYYIYVNSVKVGQVNSLTNTYRVDGLLSSTQYSITVSSVDAWEESDVSTAITPTTLTGGITIPMTTLNLDSRDIKLTYQNATADGDQFYNDGQTIFFVKNASGVSVDVTFNSIAPCNYGNDHNITVAVAAGATKAIGKFDKWRFNNGKANVEVTYSAVASVTVSAVSFAR